MTTAALSLSLSSPVVTSNLTTLSLFLPSTYQPTLSPLKEFSLHREMLSFDMQNPPISKQISNATVMEKTTKLAKIARISNQNWQPVESYVKQLTEDYTARQTKMTNNQMGFSSHLHNQLWPNQEYINNQNSENLPNINNERSDQDYDQNDLARSVFPSPIPVLNPLISEMNYTFPPVVQPSSEFRISSVTVILSLTIGLPLGTIITILLICVLFRENVKQRFQHHQQQLSDLMITSANHNGYNNNTNNNSNRFLCGKMAIKNRFKKENINFEKAQNLYEKEACGQLKYVYDVNNLWFLEKSRLVVFHEMRLGAGAFCNVYKGAIEGSAPVSKVNPSITAYNTFRDCMCAVKMLPSSADSTAHSDFLQEINFMKSLKHHPYLVSMLGISMDNYGNLMLLIEYCDLGDLLHLIRNKKEEIITNHSNEHTKLRITDMILFAWQISNGLEYLSSIGCVHRDVAARNVFVTSNSICKIGDFGLCRISNSAIHTGRGKRLPLKWMAPESLRAFEYSTKSDVWSYGVLLYELFSFGEIPYTLFQASDILEFLDSGGRLSQPDHCPNEIYRIMLQCWQHEPKLRPMFTEICANLKAIDKFSLKQNMRSEILNEQSNDQI